MLPQKGVVMPAFSYISHNRISHAFAQAFRLPLTENSRYILFSDCHRGIGNANDNFLKNEHLYLAALRHYFQEGFTYIELGDGDELWENRSLTKIKEAHPDSFRILSRFYEEHRLYLLYGNHDMIKKDARFCRNNFCTYYCDCTLSEKPLFPDLLSHESIILSSSSREPELFLTHGHQAEALNSTLWRLSRFLVRYFWKPLELLGVPDPTSAAKNNTRKKRSEKCLTSWAQKHGCILITGHTHHPMTGDQNSPYFNTGSCIHPGGITGIEIIGHKLFLVKWSIASKEDLTLCVERTLLK